MELIIIGIAVGLAISIPMGSVGISVIHRVFSHNTQKAYAISLGSITADILFGITAIYGLSNITDFIKENQGSFHIVGGIALIYISINLYLKKTTGIKQSNHIYNLGKDFVTGFILTITNPLTAIAILALFAWFGISNETKSLISSLILIIGLITGLLIWWTTLIQIISRIKNKFEIKSLKIINQIFGFILFILGILVLTKVI